MYEMSKEALIQALTGRDSTTPPRLDIQVDWDPQAIKEETQYTDENSNIIIGSITLYGIPLLFFIGFLAQAFGGVMIDQICMAIFSGLVLATGLGAVADRFYLDRNERAGNFKNVAFQVYRVGSSYWKYKNFDQNLEASVPPIMYLVALATGTIALHWYLGLFLLTLAAVAKIYMIIMVDSKARSLIRYQETWEAQEAADKLQAAERQSMIDAKKQEVADILAAAGEPPEHNVVTAEGPVYDPNPLEDEREELFSPDGFSPWYDG